MVGVVLGLHRLFFICMSLIKENIFMKKVYFVIHYKKYSFLERRIRMRAFSYKRLFKKLIDLDMTNNELMEKAKVSKSTFYKMKNGQNVTTDVLLRICNALDCDIEDIMECIEER